MNPFEMGNRHFATLKSNKMEWPFHNFGVAKIFFNIQGIIMHAFSSRDIRKTAHFRPFSSKSHFATFWKGPEQKAKIFNFALYYHLGLFVVNKCHYF